MTTVAATTLSSQLSTPTSAQHSYGTRIRSNSTIKPSARLRQSPAPTLQPRRIRPVPSKLKDAAPASPVPESQPTTLPPFPPPNVMLHSDDANSKVFLAIGRSFMSVENRAMTIKDLSEMTMKFGLMCQNVSAAGQAITTYIRNHLQRCETEQDHPLLFRHTLSGTPSDDDLAPALHSRVGGAHCTVNPEGRITNFRRGTMVWYLSKAAGAPCPFARAGIQLSEYTENGKVGVVVNPAKERKRERDRMRRAQQTGQKRKRLPRACANKAEESESSDEDRRPPKVKLTLRLRPSSAPCRSSESPAPQLSPPSEEAYPEIIDISHDDSDGDSEDDSMSYESSESSEEESDDELDSESEASSPRPASPSLGSPMHEEGELEEDTLTYSRASIPFESDGYASPPPDSEDEEDDYHISMTGSCHIGSDYDEDDMDWHSDHLGDFDETDTQWGESPGPRSPSVQFEEDEIAVKQEPRDVRSLLESWDEFDVHTASEGMKVLDVIARAAADSASVPPLKVEPVDDWDWDAFRQAESSSFSDTLGTDEYLAIKQEEDDPSLPFDSIEPLENICQSPLSPSPSSSAASSPRDYCSETTVESRRPSGCLWHDAEILGPDSVKLNDLEEGAWYSSKSTIRNETQPEAGPSSLSRITSSQSHSLPSISEQASSSSIATLPPSSSTSLTHVNMSSPSPRSKPQLHLPVRDTDYSTESDPEQPVIVHTCQPCVPAICATELEGVSVYQMILGSSMILRRIDTDFVNISPIYDFLGLPHPPLDIANAVTVCQGSSIICGTWVPAPTAREMIGDQSLVNVFLSDQLNERFPPALQDFYRSNTQGRSLGQFGPHFRSTIEARRESNSSFKLELPSRDPTSPWEGRGISPWDVEDHLLSVHPPFALAAAVRPPPLPSPEDDMTETPLSPKEEEIFHSLCSAPEWESTSESASAEPAAVDEAPEVQEPPPRIPSKPRTKDMTARERPLRRSKRVANANAIVTRSRTRSVKRDSRSSLS